MIRKRSVTLQAHATSVSLEDQYWEELKRMAAELGMSLSTLIERVDAARGSHNLSSALRLAVLADLKAKAATALPPDAGADTAHTEHEPPLGAKSQFGSD